MSEKKLEKKKVTLAGEYKVLKHNRECTASCDITRKKYPFHDSPHPMVSKSSFAKLFVIDRALFQCMPRG